MNFNEWHLAYPIWLWGLMMIPLIWSAYLLLYRPYHSSKQLERFIDPHLLPFLLVEGVEKKSSWWKVWLEWSFVWGCLILALAGPRWGYREIEMISKDQALVILLDLSESMNATDVKPSRLVRAKQKIEDLLLSKGVKMGLIAFAADPHMISPITDDKETIRHLLPSLSTDLVYVQGSRLSPALKMAAVMLEAEPGHNKAMVIISDGGFEDRTAIAEVKQLADKGMAIHAVGIGTEQGVVLQDHQGKIIKKNGGSIISKLSRGPMEEISRLGGGYYIEQNHSPYKDAMIVDALARKAEALEAGQTIRLWDEGFLWFLLPAVPFVLWWFRRGGLVFAAVALLSLCFPLEGGLRQDYFMNSEELGKEALDEGKYESAADFFQDPYRKGVACYKAGNFAEAEKLFQYSSRPEVACDAAYNLGNALAKQQKFKEAAAAYEKGLEKWPDHQKSKENLALMRRILEQQQEKSSEKQEEQKEKESDQNSKGSGTNHPENQEKREKTKEEEGEDPQADHQKKKNIENPENSENRESSGSNSDRLKEEEEEHKSAEHSQAEQKTPEERAPEKDIKGENQHGKKQKTQEDQDADVWLNRLSNDPKTFLKNKFYIESRKNGTKEGIDPW